MARRKKTVASQPLGDQADSLRVLAEQCRAEAVGQPMPRMLAVIGGHRRSGASLLAVNLAAVMAKRGSRLLLFDTHRDQSDVDVLLALNAPYGMSQVRAGKLSIDGLPRTVFRFDVLPAGAPCEGAGACEAGHIISALKGCTGYDLLIADLDRSEEESARVIMQLASERCLVMSPEPQMLAQTYSTVKMLAAEWQIAELAVAVGKAASLAEGVAAFERLNGVVQRFLDIRLTYVGCTVYDQELCTAIGRCRPVVVDAPFSDSALNYGTIALRLLNGQVVTDVSAQELIAPGRRKVSEEVA